MIHNNNLLIFITAFILLLIFLNFFCKKIKLVDTGLGIQKSLNQKDVPLSGGLYFILSLFYLSLNFYTNIDIFFIFFYFLIFLIGILSDVNIFKKPSIKLVYQIIIIFFLLLFFDIYLVQKTSVFFIDFLINYKIFKYIFSVFCIVICINGSNFIDGTNSNSALNSLIINIVLFNLCLVSASDFQTSLYFKSLIILHIIYITFNFGNKCFLGDSGSFLLGLVNSTAVIYFTQYYKLPPVFAVCILFYTWFEILFSFIRKFFFKKSPLQPDNFHLHLIIKKKLDLLISNNTLSSNITSIFINFILSINLYFVFVFRYQNFVLYLFIILQSFIYLTIYSCFINYNDYKRK